MPKDYLEELDDSNYCPKCGVHFITHDADGCIKEYYDREPERTCACEDYPCCGH